MLFVLSKEIRAAKGRQERREGAWRSGTLGAKLFSAADSLENMYRPDNPITAGLMRKIVPEGLYYEIMTWMPLDSNAIFLTWDLAGTLVCFQGVAILAVAAEWASLVKAVLATNSRRIALVNIITGFRVIAQLITRGARALGPKRPLNTTVCAASIVVRAALLVWIQKTEIVWNQTCARGIKKVRKYPENHKHNSTIINYHLMVL